MSEITIIGGVTADIEGSPNGELLRAESNPGKISISYGGVGRNIAENLGRMGASVSFFSVVGDDFPGRNAVRELAALGIDVSGVKTDAGESTAMYLSIMDFFGDLELALCNMDALERISPDFIDHVAATSKGAKIVALDTNLNEETLTYAVEKFAGVPLFLDPVSAAKAGRARNVIGQFHTIKPNRKEAEILTGMEIVEPSAVEKAGEWFLKQGVQRVFLTLSAGGVYYCDQKVSGMLTPQAPQKAIASATGAGDAFSAAVLYGTAKGFVREDLLSWGMAAASLTLESRTPVNPLLSTSTIEKRIATWAAAKSGLQ